jgi:hypothetical protein
MKITKLRTSALSTLPRRSCLTHHEATLAVYEVMIAVADSSDACATSNALDRAVTLRGPATLVDRMALIDALLDVRLEGVGVPADEVLDVGAHSTST